VPATLLSDQAQRVIGAVGPQTQGVEKLLRRIGFIYADRVDPFDGGPHFIARTDDVSLVRGARELDVQVAAAAAGQPCLVARQSGQPPFFVAVLASCQVEAGELLVAPPVAEALGVQSSDRIWSLPLG
jgi:arginine N-succinyltransferase